MREVSNRAHRELGALANQMGAIGADKSRDFEYASLVPVGVCVSALLPTATGRRFGKEAPPMAVGAGVPASDWHVRGCERRDASAAIPTTCAIPATADAPLVARW